jgi:hypothetical protein
MRKLLYLYVITKLIYSMKTFFLVASRPLGNLYRNLSSELNVSLLLGDTSDRSMKCTAYSLYIRLFRDTSDTLRHDQTSVIFVSANRQLTRFQVRAPCNHNSKSVNCPPYRSGLGVTIVFDGLVLPG